jgi:hypothetical protein
MFLYLREPRVITSPSDRVESPRRSQSKNRNVGDNPYPDFEQSYIFEDLPPVQKYEPENNHVITIDI